MLYSMRHLHLVTVYVAFPLTIVPLKSFPLFTKTLERNRNCANIRKTANFPMAIENNSLVISVKFEELQHHEQTKSIQFNIIPLY